MTETGPDKDAHILRLLNAGVSWTTITQTLHVSKERVSKVKKARDGNSGAPPRTSSRPRRGPSPGRGRATAPVPSLQVLDPSKQDFWIEVMKGAFAQGDFQSVIRLGEKMGSIPTIQAEDPTGLTEEQLHERARRTLVDHGRSYTT